MHESFLTFRGARWLWIGLALVVISGALYVWQAGSLSEPPNGGTWLGYALGTIGALLIVWLLYFGRRKRNYMSTTGTLQSWLSAHVYLGTALLFVATLHTGIQFGWNVHTLAFALMSFVIFSGMFGVWAYVRYPDLLTANTEGKTLPELSQEVADLDKQIRRTGEQLAPELYRAIGSAVDRAGFGGSAWAQLTAKDISVVSLHGDKMESNANMNRIIGALAERLAQSSHRDESNLLQQAIELFGLRNQLLRRIRRDIQIQAILRIWLYIHVPMSFATVAALIVHIFAVFLYW